MCCWALCSVVEPCLRVLYSHGTLAAGEARATCIRDGQSPSQAGGQNAGTVFELSVGIFKQIGSDMWHHMKQMSHCDDTTKAVRLAVY